MGPRAGPDRCGKSRRHRDSIPGPSSPLAVAIPTELPGPLDSLTVFFFTERLQTFYVYNVKYLVIRLTKTLRTICIEQRLGPFFL